MSGRRLIDGPESNGLPDSDDGSFTFAAAGSFDPALLSLLLATAAIIGDTVNTASRMESHGAPGRIQLTDSTRQRLGDPFVFEERGIIEIKGKGEMPTWYLVSRKT